jgi:hypothetical protein
MNKTSLTYYLFSLFLIFSIAGVSASDNPNGKTPENCSNFVLIQGSSNINRFEFIHETPRLVSNKQQSNRFNWQQEVIVPVKEFTGGNQHMRKDFLELLKATEYPVIQIDIEPKNTEAISSPAEKRDLNATITLAGHTHKYVVPCKISACDSSEILINGSLKVNLTDFNIEPPKKVLGTIKVNDEVFITFAFKHEFVR